MSTGLGEIVLYRAADGGPALDVRLERESVWLDAHQMAELFGRDRTVIVRHIGNIYATGELQRETTCAKNAQVAADGKVRQMDFYNLDMIISVGYRVNSLRGTQFRIWATNVLRQHVDGNKRIAAALFLWFPQKNQALYRTDGGKRIADNALVAMTLLIAESRPAEKDILTRVVVNLIDKQNG